MVKGVVLQIDGLITIVKNSEIQIRVLWFNDIIPPGVAIGKKISLVGELATSSMGRHALISGALLFRGNLYSVRKSLLARLAKLIVPVASYMEKP